MKRVQVAVASDIHLEFYDQSSLYPKLFLEDSENTILVLAGDIVTHNSVNKTVGWWKTISEQFKHVVYVAGNHDFYGTSIEKGLTRHQRIFDSLPNVHFLENENIELDGVVFFGATLWTDIERGSVMAASNVRRGMMDFNHIKNFTIDKWIELNAEARHEMFSQLKDCHRPVIVTHHLPDYNFIESKFKQSPINAGFANTYLFQQVLDELNPSLYIFGHSHSRQKHFFGDTTVISNAMGYPGYEDSLVYSFALEKILI